MWAESWFIELLPTDQLTPQDFAKMSFSALFFKSKVRYDIAILKLLQSIYPHAAHSTAFPWVAQIERGIWLVTRDVANILVTASRIGS